MSTGTAGATYYAIAAGLLRICEAILRDESTVLSVSTLIEDYYGLADVYLSLPAVVDRGGIEQVLRLEINPGEVEGLRRSAQILRGTLDRLDLGTTAPPP